MALRRTADLISTHEIVFNLTIVTHELNAFQYCRHFLPPFSILSAFQWFPATQSFLPQPRRALGRPLDTLGGRCPASSQASSVPESPPPRRYPARCANWIMNLQHDLLWWKRYASWPDRACFPPLMLVLPCIKSFLALLSRAILGLLPKSAPDLFCSILRRHGIALTTCSNKELHSQKMLKF